MKIPFSIFFGVIAALVALMWVIFYGSVEEPSDASPATENTGKRSPQTPATVTQVEIAPASKPNNDRAVSRDQAYSAMPAFMTEGFLSASLSALANNGANLSLPMPSKHLVRCESKNIAQQVQTWGRQNGYEPKQPVIFRGHGGVEFFDVELVKTEIPDATGIQQQGLKVRDAIAAVTGAEYTTWVGEIVK